MSEKSEENLGREEQPINKLYHKSTMLKTEWY